MHLADLITEMNELADPSRARASERFFKTGVGEYGEGDMFIGLTVPQQRTLAKKYVGLARLDVLKLLHGHIHEHRLTALIILTHQYKKLTDVEKIALVDSYLSQSKWINNWDLVDVSAPYILGDAVVRGLKSVTVLNQLAQSSNIWERRIAMVACAALIKDSQLQIPIEIATLLINDTHDLIQKAVGWMLREVGKKDETVLKKFLDQHSPTMPRTALRYAIEKFSPEIRADYLARKNKK